MRSSPKRSACRRRDAAARSPGRDSTSTIASASAVGSRGLLAVHSVRRGADGESEAQVRAALRAQRESAAA
jgi:hypothetical protein